MIVSADHDPLCDEGHLLAESLRHAAVTVLERCEQGMVHRFVQSLDPDFPRVLTVRWNAGMTMPANS